MSGITNVFFIYTRTKKYTLMKSMNLTEEECTEHMICYIQLYELDWGSVSRAYDVALLDVDCLSLSFLILHYASDHQSNDTWIPSCIKS